jgi:hypothetical protein
MFLNQAEEGARMARSADGDLMVIARMYDNAEYGDNHHEAKIYRSWKDLPEDAPPEDRPVDFNFEQIMGALMAETPSRQLNYLSRLRPARFQHSMIQEP